MGNFQSKEKRRRRGQKTVGTPILHQGDPGLVAMFAWQGMVPPPHCCRTRTFSCKGVRCHLATMKPSRFGPKIGLRKDAAAQQPLDTVSQPQRWREAVTLHLAMTWGLAASIPPSAASCSAGRFGRTSLVNWKDLKGRGEMLI